MSRKNTIPMQGNPWLRSNGVHAGLTGASAKLVVEPHFHVVRPSSFSADTSMELEPLYQRIVSLKKGRNFLITVVLISILSTSIEMEGNTTNSSFNKIYY